jgi:photosystem II stability/assembly factor-like uncharacterized protein
MKMICFNRAFFRTILILHSSICFFTSCNNKDEPEINYSWIPVGYQLDVEPADELNSPISILFINEQVGFLYNKKSVNNIPSFSFVRTDDGCATFVDISDQIDAYVKEICFPDNQTGYLVTDNYSLYKTNNQGQTWIKIENLGFGEVIQAGSNYAEKIFIMFKKSDDDYSFRYSNDGGLNWSIYNLELDPFLEFSEVNFQFLENNPEIGFFNNRQTIYKTSNGGESWGEYFEFNEYGFNKYWFIDEETVYIACGLGIYKSTNGGSIFQKLVLFNARYWQVLSENEIYVAAVVVVQRTYNEFKNLEVMNVNTPTDLEYDHYIRDISFYDQKKGYAISGNGIVYKTTE